MVESYVDELLGRSVMFVMFVRASGRRQTCRCGLAEC